MTGTNYRRLTAVVEILDELRHGTTSRERVDLVIRARAIVAARNPADVTAIREAAEAVVERFDLVEP